MITVGSDPHRFATLKMLDISFIISCIWLQSINRGFTPHSCIIYNITYPFHNPTFSRSIPRTSTEEKYGTMWRVAERSRKRFSRRRLFIQRLQMASKNLYLPEVLVAQK